MSEPRDDPEETAPASDPKDRRTRDRRSGDRRKQAEEVAVERRKGPDRRKRQRRARKGPNQYELSEDELEFIRAVNAFKEQTGRPFPTWSEVLKIVRELGYRKS